MKYIIELNGTTSKTFVTNQLEEQFFDILYDSLSPQQNSCVHLYRMSDGTLSVYYATYPIGKIKLQGRNHWMQAFKGIISAKLIEGDFDNFIHGIDYWKNYIRLHCK